VDQVYTVPEVAEYLKISKSKLYTMVRKNQIPYIRIGKNVRIVEKELVEWLEERRNERTRRN